jgi:hypothetical protein
MTRERLGSWGSDGRSLGQSIRSAAFRFVTEQKRLHGDILPRDPRRLLAKGGAFEVDGGLNDEKRSA